MAISDRNKAEFMDKMTRLSAGRPQAPLRVIDEAAGLAKPAASPAPVVKKSAIVERTMSFRLAEQDYEAIEEVIFSRKRKGEKRLTNKDAGREMVRDWLMKNGAKAFDYGAD